MNNMKWISVKDQLPEEYHFYLVYINGTEGNEIFCDKRFAIHLAFFNGKEFINENSKDGKFHESFKITHWMPLPECPE